MMKVTIGADPEFGFFVKRKTQYYRDLEEKIDNGGYDKSIITTILGRTCESYGYDYGGDVGELRPHHASNANYLNKNIYNIMGRCYKYSSVRKAKGLCFNGGSLSYGSSDIIGDSEDVESIGGHIHFGTEYSEKLMWRMMLPSVFMLYIESTPNNRVRRGDCGYGRLMDYRNQPYGFEYRCPASWLVEPKLSLGVLSLYHSVVRAHANKNIPTIYHSLVRWFLNNKDEPDLIDKYNTFDKHFWDKYISDIIVAIKTLPDYRFNDSYHKNIDYLFNNYYYKKKVMDERMDIFKSWGMR
jgi:hypothetical protein